MAHRQNGLRWHRGPRKSMCQVHGFLISTSACLHKDCPRGPKHRSVSTRPEQPRSSWAASFHTSADVLVRSLGEVYQPVALCFCKTLSSATRGLRDGVVWNQLHSILLFLTRLHSALPSACVSEKMHCVTLWSSRWLSIVAVSRIVAAEVKHAPVCSHQPGRLRRSHKHAHLGVVLFSTTFGESMTTGSGLAARRCCIASQTPLRVFATSSLVTRRHTLFTLGKSS